MIWLAKMIDALSPILFSLIAMLLAFLIVSGISNDVIAFGTGRSLVYIVRTASPALYYGVLLIYCALLCLCCWIVLRTFRLRRRD